MAQLNVLRLTELKPGQSAFIAKVSDHIPSCCATWASWGFIRECKSKGSSQDLNDNLVTVRLNASEHALGYEAANHIFVTEA